MLFAQIFERQVLFLSPACPEPYAQAVREAQRYGIELMVHKIHWQKKKKKKNKMLKEKASILMHIML